ncbi:cbb3-type cytochrome oxidase assembly protein CcoS [Campylobacter jejuni]|uniref:cbb3-type cytochrome oxidase assembly protein CcoS n=1 Tax=Campylobacter jejuni TaxID=197 RepID=UPI00035923BF|nr:cbb3-type cytochrome oxidase assembly protein CcoS [Campylobacter jejuni]AGQ94370.1 cytochrome C oxidase subunit II [Campylobacter jejuni 32488]EAH5110234.1 cbb3-type cytochrome oxidase assembly protein CcoS [Campylobacter jejuni]EAI3538487.1 cbb3-type cytochrome oxidase assembly protein CcoS [Campylobacter jejuni]EAI4787549.1 cbb3-type cytochrome oxidase assembly protein CcoS [Campylobacter jejuni]EAI4933487.1 cbb3-type cytochrome oxidase assembly protein CcoS [Campylobacter jejuni]
MNSIIMMMIGVSILAFFIILATLLWGIKNKQFDDDYKFTTLNDDEDSLRDAIELERRKKEALDKKGFLKKESLF